MVLHADGTPYADDVSGGASPGTAQGTPAPASAAAAQLHSSFGPDVALVEVDLHEDGRGKLAVVDLDALPFTVRRVFGVTDVPAGTRRGGHRHARGNQALFCLRGCIRVELSCGGASVEVLLLPDGVGLRIAAGVWAQQHYVEDGSELLVLASEPYDPSTYDSSPS